MIPQLVWMHNYFRINKKASGGIFILPKAFCQILLKVFLFKTFEVLQHWLFSAD
jgi:hypothetical protein